MSALPGVLPLHSRPWLVNAGVAAVAAFTVTGWNPGWAVLTASGVALLARGKVLAILVAALVAAPPILWPEPMLPEGELASELVLATDARDGPYGNWALGEIDGVGVFVDLGAFSGHAGDVYHFDGLVTEDVTNVGGRPRQIVAIDELTQTDLPAGLYLRGGALVRHHVVGRLSGDNEARSLLAGFLVGETSGLSEVTVESMRKAGLSHFVAVSGSNVALFLGFVAAVTLPLGIGPKRRAVAGLLALPLFVVATGYEPSVVRASAMAALVLAGRLLDVVFEVWQVIALASIAVLAHDPWLIRSVGFQLSVMATCGVVAGARWPGVSGKIRRALAITLGAQLAVAPLLLWHFGSIPLLSPLSNLVAAPLVTIATLLGIVAVSGPTLALIPGEWVASLVIDISHMSAGWPQVGWIGFIVWAGLVPIGARMWRRSPEVVALLAAGALVIIVLPGSTRLDAGEVAVLDIGQGDAILIAGGEGRYALVDGGREQPLLIDRLREFGVRHLDLVVMTHGDADHAGGLEALPGRIGIGEIWERSAPHQTPSGDRFIAEAIRLGIPVLQPAMGARAILGSVEIQVLGPERRYASPNDQSMVLLLTGPARTMLLSGDIEVVAQAELDGLDVDVLKVPHHGGGTSDPDWLSSTGADLAVISVGTNDFGHPVPWVIDVLETSGAVVQRTDVDGTVVVDLAG
ncbi:MAG: ComEC/Rec2 family competence protein [Acidimicrobiia bacterium]